MRSRASDWKVLRLPAGLAAWALVLCLPALAQQAGPVDAGAGDGLQPDESGDEAGLEDLLEGAGTKDVSEAMFALEVQANQTVTSTTKREQHVTRAPSVVTVISGAEIQSRGYASLAEVLRTVPGFYDVYDLVTHNIGIRGINGGNQASGNVLKLMIDGQPVSFRPSTGNLFGEELIPLVAVERIEIIRGPGSALYGANAFLGVVNVITRAGGSVQGALLSGRLETHGRVGGIGGGAVVGFAGDGFDVLVAGHAMHQQRSSLTLPESSPALEAPSTPLRPGMRSAGDLARPKSALAKASIGRVTGLGKVSVLASVQNLEAVGAFQSTAPLSSRTRVAVLNQSYRLSWELEPHERLALKVSGGYFDSRPGGNERYDVGQPRSLLKRSVAASGFEIAAEARAWLGQSLDLTGGVDFLRETHLLQAYDQLLLDETGAGPAGTLVSGEGSGRQKTLQNLGGFVQAIYQVTPSLGLTGGARLEWHNVYGVNLSPRLGLVYAPPQQPWYLKLLGGTSFKAPSAEQLYTQPMKTLDLQGNESLRAQTARTVELAGGYHFGDFGEVTVNLFATQVLGRVEFVQRGLYVTATNSPDQLFGGGELDSRFRLADGLNLRLGLGAAAKVWDSANDSVLVGPRADQPLFPLFQAHLIVDLRLPLPFVPLRLSPELSFVGPRGASQSNVLELNDPYELQAYVYAAVSLATPDLRLIRGRLTKVVLRATNILGTHRAEPGFGGIDTPVQGPAVFLSVTQGL